MTNKKHTTNILNATIGRRTFLGGVAATGALTLGSPFINRASAGETLKIGVLLPRSNHLAKVGQVAKVGADLSLPILSDLGLGQNIEIMHADTESNPDVGRTQAEKLIRDGAHMLVGAWDSGTTTAVAQVAEQKGVPLVINIAASPKITEQGFKYVFRNFPKAGALVTGALEQTKAMIMGSGADVKSAVMLHINDTFGTAMYGAVKALAPKVGMPFEITDYIGYDPKTKSLSVEVAKAKAQNPDLLLVMTRVNDAILLVKEMVKQRFEPKGIIGPGSPGIYQSEFHKGLGKYGDFAASAVPWFNPQNAISQEISNRFFANSDYTKMSYQMDIGFTFEAIMICAEAYKRAGTTNPQELAAALRQTNITDHPMAGGAIKFDDKGQNDDIDVVMVQNIGRKAEVVLPSQFASADPVFPMPGWKGRS